MLKIIGKLRIKKFDNENIWVIYNFDTKKAKLFDKPNDVAQIEKYYAKTIQDNINYLVGVFAPKFDTSFGTYIQKGDTFFEEKYLNKSDEELTDASNCIDEFIQFERKFFNFFAEFRLQDAPSGYGDTFRRRELNTFICTPREKRKEYVAGYFQLFDYQYKEQVLSKLESEEFELLCKEADNWEVEPINKRLTILWGGYGEGKTTFIQNHPVWSKYRFDTLDNSLGAQEVKSMFYFEDGKPVYIPSELMKAIINGEDGIILDELGHARLDYLEGIQAITDNKSEIIFEGKTYKIKDNFEVIATMNLYEADCVHKIPQGLLSRAKEITYFVASDEDIARQMKPKKKGGN